MIPVQPGLLVQDRDSERLLCKKTTHSLPSLVWAARTGPTGNAPRVITAAWRDKACQRKTYPLFFSLPLFPFSWEDSCVSLALGCLQAHQGSCKVVLVTEPVPTLSNPLIFWNCRAIICTGLKTVCRRLSESIFQGSVTVCHCLRVRHGYPSTWR